MTPTTFDRGAMAQWHANQHLTYDPGVREIHFLPGNAHDREIRFVEVNDQIIERPNASREALNFGVDDGDGLTLWVIDVTPGQWERILRQELPLPPQWMLAGRTSYRRPAA